MIKRLISKILHSLYSDVVRNGLQQIKKPSFLDYRLGDSRIRYQLTRTSRDWTDCIPTYERQNRGQETYSCVTQSGLNCLEVMTKALTGIEVNYSDSFAAKVSGTYERRGNSFVNFWDSARRNGLISEELRPFGNGTISNFYRPVTSEEREAGKMWLSAYEIKNAWVFWGWPQPEKMWEALQYGPFHTSVCASVRNVQNGIYQKTGRPQDHAVAVVGGKYKEYFVILDSYEPFLKKYAWNYDFGSAQQPTLTTRSKLMLVKAPNDSKVYAVDAQGVRHWIKSEEQFNLGKNMGLWDGWDTVIEMPLTRLDKMPLDSNSLHI